MMMSYEPITDNYLFRVALPIWKMFSCGSEVFADRTQDGTATERLF